MRVGRAQRFTQSNGSVPHSPPIRLRQGGIVTTQQQAGSDPAMPDTADGHMPAGVEPPAERMMYQLTDLADNHNKFYLVELWPQENGSVRFRATWGRVGAKPQVKEKLATRREVERQIDEKLRKGYRRVELHEPKADAAGP